jgi:hypothetical protein
MSGHRWNPGGDAQHQAEQAFRATVAIWRASILPHVKELWAGWTVGERVAFVQRVDSDTLFDHGIAHDDPNTINCYRGQGQIPCDAIGITYVAATDADVAKVLDDLKPYYYGPIATKPVPAKHKQG